MTGEQFAALLANPVPRQSVDRSPHSTLAVCSCGWRAFADDTLDAWEKNHDHAVGNSGHPIKQASDMVYQLRKQQAARALAPTH